MTYVSPKPTKLNRSETMEWFDDITNFKFMHSTAVEVMQVEEWLGID